MTKQVAEDYIWYNTTYINSPYIQNLKIYCSEIHICSKKITKIRVINKTIHSSSYPCNRGRGLWLWRGTGSLQRHQTSWQPRRDHTSFLRTTAKDALSLVARSQLKEKKLRLLNTQKQTQCLLIILSSFFFFCFIVLSA